MKPVAVTIGIGKHLEYAQKSSEYVRDYLGLETRIITEEHLGLGIPGLSRTHQIFSLKFSIFDISDLCGITPCLELVIQLVYLFRVQIRNVLLIFLLLRTVAILVLNSEPKIVKFLFSLLEKSVLLFSAARSPYLISFRPACARNQL